MLCGQYAQSSGQAPVLIDSNVETCTAFGSKCLPMHPLRRIQQIVERQLEQRRDFGLRPVAARLGRDATRASPRTAVVSFSSADIRRSLSTARRARRWSITTPASAVNRAEAPWFTDCFRTLFVESCPACGAGLRRVVSAASVLPNSRASATPCRRCGLARPVALLPARAARRGTSTPCSRRSRMQPPLDHYVHALKYRGARTLGRAFALLLAPRASRAVRATSTRSSRCRCIARAYASAATTRRTRSRERWPRARRCRARARHRARARLRRQTGQGARERRASVARGVSRRARPYGPAHRDRRRRRHDRRHRQCARRRAAGQPARRAVSRSPSRGLPSPVRAGTCSRARCRRIRRRRTTRCSRTRGTTARRRGP